MLFSQRNFISLFILFALVVLGICSFVRYQQSQELLKSNYWVIHTHHVIETADELQLSLGSKKIPLSKAYAALRTIKSLTKDNFLQTQRLTIIESLLWNQSVNPDWATLTAINFMINELKQEEFVLLQKRNFAFLSAAKITEKMVIVISVFSEMLILLSLLLLNYHLRERKLTEDKNKNIENELMLTNKKLRENEERFELAIKGSNTGIWDWDVKSNLLFFSEEFRKKLGLSSPSNLNEFIHIVHPDDQDTLEAAIDNHLYTNHPYNIEYRIKNFNGEYRWVHTIGQAIRDDKGNAIRMSGSILDVTERKKVEILKNEFVSIVSHELRTPLTSIKGSLGLLLSGSLGGFEGKPRKLLDIANNNCERLLLIINDILDLEKLEAGKMQYNFGICDISALVAEAVEINKSYAEKFKIRLAFDESKQHANVKVDNNRLTQVLSNLISNAIKFSSSKGTVNISITQNAESVRVSVKNRGVGIPEQHQSKIFQKFSQVDSSDSRGKGGTGLGLSISKTIIEKMGGNIGFVSVPNEITEFYFDLPIYLSIPTDSAVTHLVSEMQNKSYQQFPVNKVLVLENDLVHSQHLCKLLKQLSYDCDIATDEKQAQKFLDENHYSALLIDLMLHKENGIGFIRKMKSDPRTQNLPVIIISVSNDKNSLSGEVFSVLDWLDKPIESQKLLDVINKIKTHQTLPRVLHVEDDKDTQYVMSQLLQPYAIMSFCTGISQAIQLISHQKFDLVILDLLLSDGNGVELLLLLTKYKIPVIVYSAIELDREYSEFVNHALVKSKTSNDELLHTIQKIIHSNTVTS